jgi:hypothetical protein
MVSALSIPARYRAILLFTTIIGLIGLSTHLHYNDQPFKHQVKQIFSHQRNGGNRQSWYQPWTWSRNSVETLGWKEQEEQVAEMAGVGVDRVEATRRRILDVQAQCMRDEGVWEREYGYVGMSQSGSLVLTPETMQTSQSSNG